MRLGGVRSLRLGVMGVVGLRLCMRSPRRGGGSHFAVRGEGVTPWRYGLGHQAPAPRRGGYTLAVMLGGGLQIVY